tara:strand:- start:29 stop:628 length:600 start_codon:yes stop_codon:yes gene_type:complete
MTASICNALTRAEAFTGMAERAPKPEVTNHFIDFPGRFYIATFDVADPNKQIVDCLGGAITNVFGWVNKSGKPYLAVYGMKTRVEHWQLNLPCNDNQHHYRSLLAKLQLVDLQDQAVKLVAEKGRKAVFIQVYLDEMETDAVKAQSIPEGFDAVDVAINRVRARLNKSPIDPEWRTPQTKEDYSQTASQVIDLESLPNE